MTAKIPVSVVITTLNEEKNLPRCLAALGQFDEVIVVDSLSQDNSRAIAESFGATFVPFVWNGQYPKKRQWCLDTLPLKHTFVFFVDADEEVTPELAEEIAGLDWTDAGYFIDGLYVVNGKVLKRGLRNRKLCLLDRRQIAFPVVNDLDVPGMGEIEGHYQPALKGAGALGRLRSPLLHHACDDWDRWQVRHDGYRAWERGMTQKGAYPAEPTASRQMLKRIFRALPFKGWALFVYYYIVRLGFLDGRENFDLSWRKMKYYSRFNSQ